MDTKIVMMRLTDIKPYARNPRKNDQAVDAVANSIREFGFKVPIVIDAKHEIVAGHTRYKSAQKLGMIEVPCIVADDLTPAQVKAFRLADNKVGELAGWDFDALALELEDITDIDMEQFGFEILDEPSVVSEDDYDPTPPEEPVTQLGDLWVLGRHRLLCGDSTDPNCIARLADGQMVDMMLTDPPYNVNYEGTAGKILNDNMEDGKFREFLRDAFAAAESVMKPGAVFYIWHADSEGYNFRGACHDIGWQVRQCLIWEKNSLVLGRQDYHWIHEPCLYGWKEGSGHLWASDRKQTTILKFDRPTRSGEHPTMKPVLLFDYQIQNNTKKLDIVLDPFLGSGTTIAACEQNGRTCYGLELDPRYCDVIVKRYIALAGTEGVAVMRDGEEIPYERVDGIVKE